MGGGGWVPLLLILWDFVLEPTIVYRKRQVRNSFWSYRFKFFFFFFFIFSQKGDFIGKDALLQQREGGVKQKLVHFLLEDHSIDTDLWPWGGEPIYRNGEYVGETTSSGYGYTLEQMLCLGFVSKFDENGTPVIMKNINEFILDKNAKYEIDIAGRRFPAKVGIYTPKSALAISEPSFIPVPHRARTSWTGLREKIF